MISKMAEIKKVAQAEATKQSKAFINSIKESNELQNAFLGKIAALTDKEVDELKPYAEFGEKLASYFEAGQESGFAEGTIHAAETIMKIAQDVLPEDQYNALSGAVAPQEGIDEDVEEVIQAATEQAVEEIAGEVQQENPEALEDPEVQQEIMQAAQQIGETIGQQYMEQKGTIEQGQ